MMQKMAKMDMKMGAPALKFRPRKDEPYKMKQKWGMQMEGMDHSKIGMPIDSTKTKEMDHSMMGMKMEPDSIPSDGGDTMKNDGMQGMELFSEYNYDYLKSPEKTTYDEAIPVNEILLNLTGNMSRYIWSLNGIPLSETDNIKIKGNQVTRITLNNLTMMPVSYTHLRAHETKANLVCRLLLEKKKKTKNKKKIRKQKKKNKKQAKTKHKKQKKI